MNDFVKVIDKKRHEAPTEINPSFGKGGHALVVGGGMAGLWPFACSPATSGR